MITLTRVLKIIDRYQVIDAEMLSAEVGRSKYWGEKMLKNLKDQGFVITNAYGEFLLTAGGRENARGQNR
jgi:Mn-dependent DtxR family transcriptional regulator